MAIAPLFALSARFSISSRLSCLDPLCARVALVTRPPARPPRRFNPADVRAAASRRMAIEFAPRSARGERFSAMKKSPPRARDRRVTWNGRMECTRGQEGVYVLIQCRPGCFLIMCSSARGAARGQELEVDIDGRWDRCSRTVSVYGLESVQIWI